MAWFAGLDGSGARAEGHVDQEKSARSPGRRLKAAQIGSNKYHPAWNLLKICLSKTGGFKPHNIWVSFFGPPQRRCGFPVGFCIKPQHRRTLQKRREQNDQNGIGTRPPPLKVPEIPWECCVSRGRCSRNAPAAAGQLWRRWWTSRCRPSRFPNRCLWGRVAAREPGIVCASPVFTKVGWQKLGRSSKLLGK